MHIIAIINAFKIILTYLTELLIIFNISSQMTDSNLKRSAATRWVNGCILRVRIYSIITSPEYLVTQVSRAIRDRLVVHE